jgi:uncharacterized protein YndB with AHSA1/START domain
MATQTQTTQTQDRIQKSILLRAPRSRVWRAIADPQEFGSWFGLKIDGQVAPGSKVTGTIVPTTVDATIAKQQREYEGLQFEMTIDHVEPERLFSFRWHPNGVDGDVDYTAEPTTLVSFEIEERPEGVLLTVTESGFARLPAARRGKAFAANEQGWTKQMQLIEEYLGRS